jgi:hypothetical protein
MQEIYMDWYFDFAHAISQVTADTNDDLFGRNQHMD